MKIVLERGESWGVLPRSPTCVLGLPMDFWAPYRLYVAVLPWDDGILVLFALKRKGRFFFWHNKKRVWGLGYGFSTLGCRQGKSPSREKRKIAWSKVRNIKRVCCCVFEVFC